MAQEDSLSWINETSGADQPATAAIEFPVAADLSITVLAFLLFLFTVALHGILEQLICHDLIIVEDFRIDRCSSHNAAAS